MSHFIVVVVIFVLASLVSSSARRGQPPTGRSRIPWFPPENPPEYPKPGRVLTEPWPTISQPGNPTVKIREKGTKLARAAGKESEQGEHFPKTVDQINWTNEVKSGRPAPPQKPVARTGNSVAAVDSPIPDLINSGNPLVQGIIWSEILGRPRALRPRRGPRG